MIAVSIVSHGHGSMVERLLRQVLAFPEVGQIILTRNVPEQLEIPADPRVEVVDNPSPKGFGANHNAAFRRQTQSYFCPLNPDIAFIENPFPILLEAFKIHGTALVAPMVKAPDGHVEDSIRHFPTLAGLVAKALGRGDGRYPLSEKLDNFHPDWVAGMCILFQSDAYQKLGGFDEGYFLYYEDVDICARAWKADMKVLACPRVVVIHDARRDSHRSLRHLRWHLASMARYFLKHWGRLPEVEVVST